MLQLRRFGVLAALISSVALAGGEPPVGASDDNGGKVPAPQTEAKPASPAQRRMAEMLKGVKVLRDVEYARPDEKPVRLDVYLPEDAKEATPLIIWVHGGGWQAGSKTSCPALPWVKDGFAVASVEYRFTDRAPFPAQIQDCKAAVRFLRAHAAEYNLDPKRFGAWGASAGGHLVAMLGTTCGNAECEGGALGNAECSSGVQCVCDWFGPTDFLSYNSTQAEVSPMLIKLFGGKLSEKQEVAKLASPALHIKKPAEGKMCELPPFLIVQGDKDPLVPDQQSRLLAEKIKEAGGEQQLVIVEGAGHGFTGEQLRTEFQRARDFFRKQLKVGAAAAAPVEPAAKGTAPASEGKPG
jgi:acetyl esterase/lipase